MNLFRTSLALLLPLAMLGACKSGSSPAKTEPSGPAATEPSSPTAESAAPQPEAPAPASEKLPETPSAVGTYEHPHAAFNDCDDPDGCEVQVTDTLRIEDAGSGAILVSAELNQDNEHSCTFEGTMTPQSAGHWTYASGDCRIELKQHPTSLDLTSEGCREDYCGERASLQASFPISSRKGAAR